MSEKISLDSSESTIIFITKKPTACIVLRDREWKDSPMQGG